VLAHADLAAAHVVVFAVPDPVLPDVVRAAAALVPGRRCSLWLHTSGRYDLAVLEPLRAHSVRLGALHPVAPFPDAETGYRQLVGRPMVVLGDARAQRLLTRLAESLGMLALQSSGGDRMSYHAACALAANGLTALCAAVDRLLAASAVLGASDARLLAQSLMGSALVACGDRGPKNALSGPVVRGDAATVRAHRHAVAAIDPSLDAIYRALMAEALLLAQQRGLAPALLDAVRAALQEER
jgi:predicted short-subunit dehydrogenase-like oxidoreductase (DUF2520 family)